jgi:hypothetical protein
MAQNRRIEKAYKLGCSTVSLITPEKFMSIPGEKDYKTYFLFGYITRKTVVNPELVIKFYDQLSIIDEIYPIENLFDLVYLVLTDIYNKSHVPPKDSLRLIVVNLVNEYEDLDRCCLAHFAQSTICNERLTEEELFWITAAHAIIVSYINAIRESSEKVLTSLNKFDQ